MGTLNACAYIAIGASATVVNWILEGVPIKFTSVPEPRKQRNLPLTPAQASFVDEQVQQLLQNNCIQSILKAQAHCILPIGVVPKKKNKLRLILDCRYVNEHMACCPFKQKGIEAVPTQIQQGDLLASIDLESGFHHVTINPFYRRFLCFQWKGSTYCWNVLPFGLKSAPYIFYKIVRPVVLFLRAQGVRNSAFVDDFIFMLRPRVAREHLDLAQYVLQECGWKINFGKSDLTLSPIWEFVGFRVSSDHNNKGPWIEVLPKKLRKLQRLLCSVLHDSRGQIKARTLARVTGQCIAMCRAILPAKLLLRNMYCPRHLGQIICTSTQQHVRIWSGG